MEIPQLESSQFLSNVEFIEYINKRTIIKPVLYKFYNELRSFVLFKFISQFPTFDLYYRLCSIKKYWLAFTSYYQKYVNVKLPSIIIIARSFGFVNTNFDNFLFSDFPQYRHNDF